jgi:hypothetical protein
LGDQSRLEARSPARVHFRSRFIAEAGGRTRVELEHRNFERLGAEGGAKMRREVDGGWPSILERFAQAAAHETHRSQEGQKS